MHGVEGLDGLLLYSQNTIDFLFHLWFGTDHATGALKNAQNL